MSHDATNWAIKQKGLKPATKIVLWQLADRHHPDNGCFPSIATLAEDCEMSERSVHTHIKELERLGLIEIDKETRKSACGKFRSNNYILRVNSAPSANSAVGKSTSKPSANLRSDRLQNLPTNPVREPVKNHGVPPRRLNFAEGKRFSQVTDAAHEKAVTQFPGYDIRVVRTEWAEWSARHEGTVNNADAAFLAFIKTFVKKNPLPKKGHAA